MRCLSSMTSILLATTAIHLLSNASPCRAFSIVRQVSQRVPVSGSFPTISSSAWRSNSRSSSSSSCPSSLVIRNGHITTGSDRNDNNKDNDEDKAIVKPTWTHEPYKPPPPPRRTNSRSSAISGSASSPPRRYFSSKQEEWIVPNKITMAEDKIEFSFIRSSGAGGQNVNKVRTKLIFWGCIALHCIDHVIPLYWTRIEYVYS